MAKEKYLGVQSTTSDELFISLTHNGVIVRGELESLVRRDKNVIIVASNENKDDIIDYSKCCQVIGDFIYSRLREISSDESNYRDGYSVCLDDFRLSIKIEARERNGFKNYWK
jgi:hypothetical protein